MRTVRGLGRALVARWYIIAPGIFLTTFAASVVFAIAPMTYTSTGTTVVMPPKRPSSGSANELTNPLLGIDARMSTTAATVAQSVTSPLLMYRAGLVSGQDKVTAMNASFGAKSSEDRSPFVTVTAESRDAARAPMIVGWVMDTGREDLTNRQHALKVATRNKLTMHNVVAPTPAEPVWLGPVGATVAAVLMGLVSTMTVAYGVDRIAIRRRTLDMAPLVPLGHVTLSPPIRPHQPVPTVVSAVPDDNRKAG